MGRLSIRKREDPEILATKICIQLGKKTKEFDPETLKACKATLEGLATGRDGLIDAVISLHNIFKIPPDYALKIASNVAKKTR